MKYFYICCLAATCFISIGSARYVDFLEVTEDDPPVRRTPSRPQQHRRTPEDFVAIARQRAIKLIVEKMFRALGQDFPENPSVSLPDSDVLPTVSTVNITTAPCPDVYSKCSTESFLPSCDPPNGTNPKVWNKMFNLYFPLPDDLFEVDTLLNATLQLYKNKTLPLDEPMLLNVDFFAYTRNATTRKEFITSTNITSDYIGWVTLDITDLVSNLKPTNNHGFKIQVKESTGIFWDNRDSFVRMDCSDQQKHFMPVPFGVQTEHPEQKFPSLNIRTGSRETQSLTLPDDLSYYYDDGYNYEETNLVSPIDTMSGDDPNTIEPTSPDPTEQEIHLSPTRIAQPLSSKLKTNSISSGQQDFASIELNPWFSSPFRKHKSPSGPPFFKSYRL